MHRRASHSPTLGGEQAAGAEARAVEVTVTARGEAVATVATEVAGAEEKAA